MREALNKTSCTLGTCHSVLTDNCPLLQADFPDPPFVPSFLYCSHSGPCPLLSLSLAFSAEQGGSRFQKQRNILPWFLGGPH